MKRLLAGIVIAVLAGTSPAATTRPVSAQQGHCLAGEKVVYSCRFGAKTGSVCAAPERIAYRFGAPGKPAELAIASTPDWSNVHIGGNRSRGGLNQDHIRFTTGDMHYVVHSGATGSLNESPGRRVSGIAVLRGNDAKPVADLECRISTLMESADFFDISALAPRQWNGEEDADGPFDLIY